MNKVFASGPEDQGTIPGRVISKTQKLVLDATQYYKVRSNNKLEQSKEWSNVFPFILLW